VIKLIRPSGRFPFLANPFLLKEISMATTEDLQTLVLTTLDKSNVIEDTKDLKFNDAVVDQLTLLGALNSLKSKGVQER
jgi:hypothetical protein